MKRYFSAISKNSAPETVVDLNLDIENLQNTSTSPTLSEPSSSNHSTKKRNYNQKSRAAWTKDPHLKDWLVFKEDGYTLECKYCHSVFKQPKYSNLKEHAGTKKHKSAAEPFSSARQQVLNFKNTNQYKIHEAEARTCLYIAKHTSIRSVDHFTKVTKLNYSDSSICLNTKLCKTKCSGIINRIWYPYFKRKITAEVGESPFSLLIDLLYRKYFCRKENSCKTNFLKLKPLESADVDGIVAAILSVLEEFNLKLKNLCGLGTDNASVMIGIRKGVFTKLKLLNPNIILIPCVCHSLQLAISAAAISHIPKELDFMISESYNWFSRSSARQLKYQNLFKSINDGHNPKKITQSCSTRWLSIESAVNRIHSQYLELEIYFTMEAANEDCFKISSLANLFSNQLYFAYLSFFKPVLYEVQRVNKIFESEKADFVKVLGDLEFLIMLLIKKVLKSHHTDTEHTPIDVNIDIDTSELLTRPYLGSECEEKLHYLRSNEKITEQMEMEFRMNCKNFLIKLIKELQQRMPKNLKIFKQISYISVDECLRINKKSIKPLLTDFNIDFPLFDKINSQWENLLLRQWRNTKNTEVFWAEVYQHKDAAGENPYKELPNFAISILTLPISNAEVERLFSSMNLIKTKVRNRMQIKLTNSILMIRNQMRFSKCCIDQNIPEEVVEKVGTNAAYEEISDIDFNVINEINDDM